MKLTNHQFTEVAFIFEEAKGSFHSELEKKIIAESELTKFSVKELLKIIVDGINSGIYNSEEDRVSAYWCLSKISDKKLILDFRKWLLFEIENKNSTAIFQILIALDKLDESVFNKRRTSRDVFETELNLEDAKIYLRKLLN